MVPVELAEPEVTAAMEELVENQENLASRESLENLENRVAMAAVPVELAAKVVQVELAETARRKTRISSAILFTTCACGRPCLEN